MKREAASAPFRFQAEGVAHDEVREVADGDALAALRRESASNLALHVDVIPAQAGTQCTCEPGVR